MTKKRYHSLVLSDLHLGSPVCQAELIIETLNKYDYDQLIINGDLLDSYHLHRLCKKQWSVLSELRKISKHTKCVFIAGNHDKHCDIIGTLLGFEFVNHYLENINGKKIFFTHGDIFDTFLKERPLITEIASSVYFLLQKLDKRQTYTRKIKKIVKTWKNAALELAKRACVWAHKEKYDTIVLGHTHIAEHTILHRIEYVNLGSQCDFPVTHGVIDFDGNIEIKNLEK
jgi:UDP-2,3-diacylglucosamine pyrophosphatase LpxH